MSSIPTEFDGVTAFTKANVYFNGDVLSHTILLPNGSRKTLGCIRPGQYPFGTELAEPMEIVAGSCHVKLDGHHETRSYPAGAAFDIPAKSGFDISVHDGLCEYICSFINSIPPA